MCQPRSHAKSVFTTSAAAREVILDAFDAAWGRGERPKIDDFLPRRDAADRRLLIELALTDLQYRFRAGEPARAEDYLSACPVIAADREAALELIEAELHLRRSADPSLTADGFLVRFPQYADELSAHFKTSAVEASVIAPPSRATNPDVSTILPPADKAQTAATRFEASSSTRYRPIRFHAKGGLGEVHLARDKELNRDVALKRMRQRHGNDAELRRRFMLEAEITARLQHPGIVPIYGLVADADGQPCYAMRFIEGHSLKEAIDVFHGKGGSRESGVRSRAEENTPRSAPGAPGRNPQLFASLEFRKLLGRFVDACNAIEYAHSRGVVHRDIKPQNIMLGEYGETLVVDWGLAKVLTGETEQGTREGRPAIRTREQLDQVERPQVTADSGTDANVATREGSLVGTPPYMSPEQAACRHDLVGPASDVYSLGATLYSLLTSRAPVVGTDLAAIVNEVTEGQFPPPRQIRREIPRALEAICLRAMARVPADRYTSPRALADDIEHWLADEPVEAHRESFTERSGRRLRRHKTMAAALLVFTFLIAAWGAAKYRDAQNAALFRSLEGQFGMAKSTFTPTREAWDRLDAIVRDMQRIDPHQSATKESEFLTSFAERLEAELKVRPRLLKEDVDRYEDCLTLLTERDDRRPIRIQAIGRVRTLLNQRLGENNPLFDLANPLANDELVEVIQAPAGVTRDAPDPIFATKYNSQGAVEFEASFPADALMDREIGLALDFDPENGAFDRYHVKFFGSDGNRTCRVRIMKGPEILRERNVHLPNDALTLSIKRVRGHLEAKLNDQVSLEFNAIFPLGGERERGVFAIRCPQDARIGRLRAWRTTFAGQSLLEAGDSLFATGKCGEALDHYTRQASLTRDQDDLQELRYKQARCFLDLGNGKDAERILMELAAADGGTWPPLAASELFVVKAQKHDWQGADAALARLAHVPAGSDTLGIVFDSIRSRVLPTFYSAEGLGVAHVAVLNPADVADVGRLVELALTGADLPDSERTRTTLLLAEAYEATDVGRLEGLYAGLVKHPELSDRAIRRVGCDYANLLVRTGRPSQALALIEELEQRPGLPPSLRASLSLQKARVLAAMDRYDQSRGALRAFFEDADVGQEHLIQELANAWILKGFIADFPDPMDQIEIWKEGYRQVKRADRMHDLDIAILASLSQELTDEDAKTMIANVAQANPGLFPYATTVSLDALYIPEIHLALRDMWHRPRGRSYARNMAFHRISYRTIKLIQVPLCVAEVIRKGAFDEPLPADMEEVIWTSMEQMWHDFQQARISLIDVTMLFLAWKGNRKGPLGWTAIAEKLRKDSPAQHARLAFICGCHFRKMNRPGDALMMLEEAKTAAESLSQRDLLCRLIDDEIKKIKMAD